MLGYSVHFYAMIRTLIIVQLLLDCHAGEQCWETVSNCDFSSHRIAFREVKNCKTQEKKFTWCDPLLFRPYVSEPNHGDVGCFKLQHATSCRSRKRPIKLTRMDLTKCHEYCNDEPFFTIRNRLICTCAMKIEQSAKVNSKYCPLLCPNYRDCGGKDYLSIYTKYFNLQGYFEIKNTNGDLIQSKEIDSSFCLPELAKPSTEYTFSFKEHIKLEMFIFYFLLDDTSKELDGSVTFNCTSGGKCSCDIYFKKKGIQAYLCVTTFLQEVKVVFGSEQALCFIELHGRLEV
jgi:hypothetical protein